MTSSADYEYYKSSYPKVIGKIIMPKLKASTSTLTITLNEKTILITAFSTTDIYVKVNAGGVDIFDARDYIYAVAYKQALSTRIIIANDVYEAANNLTLMQMGSFIRDSEGISRSLADDPPLYVNPSYKSPQYPLADGAIYIPRSFDNIWIGSGRDSSYSEFTIRDRVTLVVRNIEGDTIKYANTD